MQVGNFYNNGSARNPLSRAEGRTQFSLWCAMKSPLLIGTDLTIADHDTFAVLANHEAIAINQDALGVQARLINDTATATHVHEHVHALDGASPSTTTSSPEQPLVWAGPLHNGDKVLALVNQDAVHAVNITTDLGKVFGRDHGVSGDDGADGNPPASASGSGSGSFDARDIWAAKDIGTLSGVVSFVVEPHDTRFLRLTPR